MRLFETASLLAISPVVGGGLLTFFLGLLDLAMVSYPSKIRRGVHAAVEVLCKVLSALWIAVACYEIGEEVMEKTHEAHSVNIVLLVGLVGFGAFLAWICISSGKARGVAIIAAVAVHASAEGIGLALMDVGASKEKAVWAMVWHNMFEGGVVSLSMGGKMSEAVSAASMVRAGLSPLMSHASQWTSFVITSIAAALAVPSAEFRLGISAVALGCTTATLMLEMLPDAIDAIRGALGVAPKSKHD